MKSLIFTISMPLAVLLGFVVHRAGLCTVRTVAEIFSSRKAYMMVTMLKTVLWVMAVSVPIFLFLPDAAAPNRSYAITTAAIIGGFMFGVGAAVNGGCAFSTLSHLANGNLCFSIGFQRGSALCASWLLDLHKRVKTTGTVTVASH